MGPEAVVRVIGCADRAKIGWRRCTSSRLGRGGLDDPGGVEVLGVEGDEGK
jgi:hypothetical protein